MATQWPLVASRLVALLPTLPGWAPSDKVSVFRGAAYDVPTATFATVGHTSDGTITQSGSYTMTQSPDGFQYIEQGSVACQLVCTDDGPELAVLEALLFGLIDELDQAIRTDRRLGVLSQEGYAELSVDVQTTQTIPGTSASLAFAVSYYTVT